MSPFGKLLRDYRKRSRDPASGRPLSQARLGELVGDALGDGGYSGAAVSDWELGKSRIHMDDRRVLAGLMQVLLECGGVATQAEADELLLAGNYRPLDAVEAGRVFGLPAARLSDPVTPGSGAAAPPAEANWRTQPIPGPEPAEPGPSPHWTEAQLSALRRATDGWTGAGVLRALAWCGIGLVTWGGTWPLLRWPFDGPKSARNAALGAHYLGNGRLPTGIELPASAWPVVLGYAAARQVPTNYQRAYGALRFNRRDWIVPAAFGLYGPLWGAFFYLAHSWLLSAPVGLGLITLAIGLASVQIWWSGSRRAKRA